MTITSAKAFLTYRSFQALINTKDKLFEPPAFAVQINLIPGRNQVGALSARSGFPVLSGHAHTLRGKLPFYSFHEEQVYPSRAKQGIDKYACYLYTRIEKKWQE